MKLNFILKITILIIIFIFYFLICDYACQTFHEGESRHTAKWIGPPGKSNPTPGTPAAEAEHSATRETWISSGVSLIKFTENKTEFNVGDNITIVLRIINTDPSIGQFSGFSIEEEIPWNFSRPERIKFGNFRNINKPFDYNTRKLRITPVIPDDILPQKIDLKYTLQANNSGNFIMSPTILTAKRIGNEINVQSDPLYISIVNRPPFFVNWTIPHGIPLWKGDPLIVEANITDDDSDDNDDIKCILMSSLHGILNCTNHSESNKIHYFSWSLSNCSGKQQLTFVASDGTDKTSVIAEIEIWERKYWFVPSIYLWTIPAAAIAALVAIILADLIRGLFWNRQKLWNWIKMLFKNDIHELLLFS